MNTSFLLNQLDLGENNNFFLQTFFKLIRFSYILEKTWIFERGFIVSNASTLAMHEVHSANGQSNAYKYKQFPNNTIASFAVDAYLGIIYFVDSGSKSLKRHDIRSQQISTLTWSPSGKGKCSYVFVQELVLRIIFKVLLSLTDKNYKYLIALS